MKAGTGGAAAIALRTVAALLMLSTGFGLWRMATDREAIVARFPGAEGALYWSLFASGVFGLVAAAGIIALRRWGLWLYALVVVAMLVLDESARAPRAHQAAVLAGAAAIGACAWWARASFRRGSSA